MGPARVFSEPPRGHYQVLGQGNGVIAPLSRAAAFLPMRLLGQQTYAGFYYP
jgi:hypothetical protein